MTDLSLQCSPSTAAPPGAGADAAAQQRANAGPAVQETISYISTSRGQQFYENLHGEVRESIPSSGLVLCTVEDFEREAQAIRIPAEPAGFHFATAASN